MATAASTQPVDLVKARQVLTKLREAERRAMEYWTSVKVGGDYLERLIGEVEALRKEKR